MQVPLLAQALHEARLFQLHQLQRRRLGLAPEAGWHAAVYGAVWQGTAGGSAPQLALICALLASGCWDLCVLLAASSR